MGDTATEETVTTGSVHGYRFERVELEVPRGFFRTKMIDALRIFDVEVMSIVTMEDRPDFMLEEDIGLQWLKDAVEMTNQREKKGKSTLLLFRHNKHNQEADIIGKLENRRFKAPWILADLLLTNPEAIGKMERGELSKRSAEFVPERTLLWGLSLIGGAEGHFDEEFPDLVLKAEEKAELARLGSDVRLRSNLIVSKPLILIGDEMGKDKTNLDNGADGVSEALIGLTTSLETLTSLVEGVEGRLTTLEKAQADKHDDDGDEPPKKKPDDEGDPQDSGDDEKLSKLSVEIATLKNENWIKDQIANLRTKNVAMTNEEIGTELRKMSTQEGREECAKRIALLSVPTDQLDADPDMDSDEAIAEVAGKDYDSRFGHLSARQSEGLFTKEFHIEQEVKRYRLAKKGA